MFSDAIISRCRGLVHLCFFKFLVITSHLQNSKNHISNKNKRKNLGLTCSTKMLRFLNCVRRLRKHIKSITLKQGSNMFVYALTFAGPQGCRRYSSLIGEGFNDPEGSSRCECIRKSCMILIIAYSHLSLKNFGKNVPKVYFCITTLTQNENFT